MVSKRYFHPVFEQIYDCTPTECDGPFYEGKKVVDVAGGNSGLEAVIDLSTIASNVTVLEFMNPLKGDQVLQVLFYLVITRINPN